ncbi:MAG: serine/threonine-protein kinase [Gammaproteobacteria bacterium]
MTIQLDDIILGLSDGSLSLDAACEAVAAASQADPVRTRFWGQRIEAELVRGQLSRAAARALFDALEDVRSDKTVWLDAATVVPRLSPAPRASGADSLAEPTLPPIVDLEQLRAALFRPVTQPPASACDAAACLDADNRTVGLGRTDTAASDSASRALYPLESLPLGTVLNGRYRLIAPLGLGGVGQVYDAIDLQRSPESEVHVTVKVVAVDLRQQPLAYAALEEVVRRSQTLIHPNIVATYDIDRHEHHAFIVMEPLRGRWLSGLVREVRGKGLAYDKAWPLIEGIANGLAYAHRRGIVHCDLNPHAVFVCDDGTPKIMGFELVRAVPTSNESLDVLDTLTLRAYTEAYTADPWAQQGTPHPADDLYPLGVIAYELLAGVHPFQRCSLAVARQRGLHPAPIPGLHRRARKLIERCLSFERSTRPRDGRVFLRRMRPSILSRWLLAAS